MSKCEYVIEEDGAPYPRVKYNSECGFQLVVLEGYEFDSSKTSSGNESFSYRTKRVNFPSGNCGKCKNEILTHQIESK